MENIFQHAIQGDADLYVSLKIIKVKLRQLEHVPMGKRLCSVESLKMSADGN